MFRCERRTPEPQRGPVSRTSPCPGAATYCLDGRTELTEVFPKSYSMECAGEPFFGSKSLNLCKFMMVALRDRLSSPLIVELTALESLRTAVG